MRLPTAKELLDIEDNLPHKEIRDIKKRVAQQEGRANARTNLTNAAGAHVVVGTGNPFNIEDPFTGTAILYPPYVHTSGNYHIFGMENGVLQWGANSTDGKIYAGGGDVVLSNIGVWIENQAGAFGFKDTAGNTQNLYIYSDNLDSVGIINSLAGKAVIFSVTMTDAGTTVLKWREDPANANVPQLNLGKGTGGGKFSIDSSVVLWAAKDGTETVFNDDSYDIDFRVEGATDTSLLKLDAGLDAVAMGGAADGAYKLKVHGDVNVTGDIVSNGQTAFPIQTAESVLGATFTITGTAGTFQDSGLSVSLPYAGKYEITADVRGNLRGNAGTAWWLSGKLYNSTDAADVADSERLIVLTNVNTILLQQTCTINKIVEVAAAKTIKLYVARDGTGTPSWTNSAIESNTAGKTVLTYKKIG